MYSTAQIHKPSVNNFSLDLHSVINTPIHGWEKFFVPLLRRFNLNDYNIKDSFEFKNDNIQQNSGLFMAFVDIHSLFTNIPLDETINTCTELLFKENNIVSGLNEKKMFEVHSITLKESFILLDAKYYSQIDGVAMGSLFLQP